MRHYRFILAFWLASFVVSRGTVAAQSTRRSQPTSLLRQAEYVTPFVEGDLFFWPNQRTVHVRSYQTLSMYDIDRRTHKRTHIKYWGGGFIGAIPVTHAHPDWLPAGAKIVGFDSAVSGQKAWAVCWMTAHSVPERSSNDLTRTRDQNAEFGIWITRKDGRDARLLGTAPLTQQECLAMYEHKHWNMRLLPSNKEISFVYRSGLYVIPISDAKI
jgi:hypothetical protein